MLRLRIAAVLAAVAALAFPVEAQAPPGAISGTVRVANGAPLEDVSVTVSSQETGAARTVKTAATGVFEAKGLPPGTYTVTVDQQGFRKEVRKDQRLAAGQTLTLDFGLEVKIATDVTVTAMKHEDTVLSTPVSVAAPTEDVLRERGAQNIEDVAANVAGFSVQNLGPGQSQVAIRGVSSGQIARDQPGVKEQVGIYLDETPVSLSLFTPDIDLFDVSRVEVLRGPQGTLFGAGSLSGTVRYITNQPELGLTSYFAEVTGNTLTDGNQGGDVKFGFNAPIGNKAALRVAAYYNRLAGWMDAVQPDLSVKKDVNTGRRAGVRMALQIAPIIDKLTITPRVLFQDVKMDGWNRIDIYNILANPYTTTRPAVTLGDRKQFTQIGEPYTDRFFLGDVTAKYRFDGGIDLTSITSFTHRDILVVRDATALTASITGGSLGLPEDIYTLNAPLNDATKAQAWTEELRLSGGGDRFRWVGGAFYADSRRHYGQNLYVAGFSDLSGIPTQGLLAPQDSLYWSDLRYKLRQFALFGEGTLRVTDRFDVTAGLRYYRFSEDKEQIFDGIFANDNNGTSLVSQPGSTNANGVAPRLIASWRATDATTFNAQISRGFRLGGINDPINVPLCTPQDLVTFGGRDTWKDETDWNYEIGSKSRILGGHGSVAVSAFYQDIHDLQVTVTAGSCSSRLIFNVPKSRSVGGEFELGLTPNENFDFSLSAGYANARLESTLTSTAPDGTVSVVSGIESGRRLPSVPEFQAAASGTYQHDLAQNYTGYLTATYQHIGSRYTEVGDQDIGTLDLNSFAPHTIGGPLTQGTFTFDPLLPAYDLLNLRLGVRHGAWDIALFANNLTDERAYLALDRERGLRARIGYLTNQPRTMGITSRFDF